jgi:hypothetical protein
MAEQSSTVVAFRGLVPLVCLILIPVAAFCGGSFPAVVKAIQSGHWPTLADFHSATGSGQASEAPRFVPPASGSALANDPKTTTYPGQAIGFGPAPQFETTRSPVVAVNYNAPINSPPTAQLPHFLQDNDTGLGPDRRLSPLPPGADNLVPLDHAATTEHFEAPAGLSGSAGSSSSNNPLKGVLDRLQKLGATYFVLETYGDEIREFRFYCRMSIGGNRQVTRPFWCSDTDPLKAMTQVLKQVEDWQVKGG